MNGKNLLMSEYEQLLRQNPDDTEARWQLVRCRYEVVTAGNHDLPGRYNLPPIYEDRDYLKLLAACEGEEKKKYIKIAEQLQDAMDETRKAAEAMPKYDVYLAFDTASTEDTRIAVQIRDSLSVSGITCYFDPERNSARLPDACRLAALGSAKVLIVIGTAAEHMNVPEVEGAWKRFRNMMERDSSRHLLPVYQNMKPEDFPSVLSKIQGVDIGRIGVLEKILPERIKELTGRKQKVIYVRKPDGHMVNLSNLMLRIQFDLEDGCLQDAKKRMDQFAEKYGEDYEQFRELRAMWIQKSKG